MLLNTSTRLFAALPPEKTTMPLCLGAFGEGWREGGRDALSIASVGVCSCMMNLRTSAEASYNVSQESIDKVWTIQRRLMSEMRRINGITNKGDALLGQGWLVNKWYCVRYKAETLRRLPWLQWYT